MSFKKRQIRKAPPFALFRKLKKTSYHFTGYLKTSNKKPLHYLWVGLLILFAFWVVTKVTLGAYHLIANFKSTAKEVVFTAASDLKTDRHGYTNIVLLGDGGNKHDGVGLMDTIMVASIDHEKNAVTLLSIPRDYYVGKNGIGIGKINEVYLANRKDTSEKGGYAAYQRVLGEIVNLDIQYYVRVNFNAFVDIVDSLGGVTVDVPNAIYDREYPNETETGASLFKLEAGLQEMDGKTALKFARSRKTTSDYDRAARQQLLLGALQEKALSAGVLTSPSTLKGVYDSVQKNMNTNMDWREMLALAEFGDQFDRSHLVMKVLSTREDQDGGFLYDGDRSVYGGSVLLPDGGNFDLIHRYTDLIFNHRELFYSPPKLQILNATKTSGIASDAKAELARFGFNVVDVGNYLDPEGGRQYGEESILLYYDWEEKAGEVLPKYADFIQTLSDFIPFIPLPGNKLDLKESVDMTLILGKDYDGILSE